VPRRVKSTANKGILEGAVVARGSRQCFVGDSVLYHSLFCLASSERFRDHWPGIGVSVKDAHGLRFVIAHFLVTSFSEHVSRRYGVSPRGNDLA